MANDFLCPKCKGYLNVADHIVFAARTEGGKAGLIFLSSELGDYKTISHLSFKPKDGTHVDFLCPICHENLTASEIDKNLAMVLMRDENHNLYEILFSELIGEKATYVMKHNLLDSFGENASKYVNYFGAKPNY